MADQATASKIHCLRISKTGSTTLRALLEQPELRRSIRGANLVLHGHKKVLPDVLQYPQNSVAFFLREPLARFVSGFNNRLQEPPPESQATRSSKERAAVRHFPTANDLAEALTSSNELIQDRAYVAMENLMHARLHYTDWLVSTDYLRRRTHRIAFIGFLETLDEDVRRFLDVLGVHRPVALPHERQAPDNFSRDLSDEAQRNLWTWYAEDMAIYEWALAQRSRWAPGSISTDPAREDAGRSVVADDHALPAGVGAGTGTHA